MLEITKLTIRANRQENSVFVNDEAQPHPEFSAFAGGIQFPPFAGIRSSDGELLLISEARLDHEDETTLLVATQAIEPMQLKVSVEMLSEEEHVIRFVDPLVLELPLED